MSKFRPHATARGLAFDDATLDALADRVADRVIQKLEARGVLDPVAPEETAITRAATNGGSTSLSPELMRGLVRMVMDNLAAPDTGSVVRNLQGLGMMHPDDGGLPLHQDSLGPRKGR